MFRKQLECSLWNSFQLNIWAVHHFDRIDIHSSRFTLSLMEDISDAFSERIILHCHLNFWRATIKYGELFIYNSPIDGAVSIHLFYISFVEIQIFNGTCINMDKMSYGFELNTMVDCGIHSKNHKRINTQLAQSVCCSKTYSCILSPFW